jgi:hypothetical protein
LLGTPNLPKTGPILKILAELDSAHRGAGGNIAGLFILAL